MPIFHMIAKQAVFPDTLLLAHLSTGWGLCRQHIWQPRISCPFLISLGGSPGRRYIWSLLMKRRTPCGETGTNYNSKICGMHNLRISYFCCGTKFLGIQMFFPHFWDISSKNFEHFQIIFYDIWGRIFRLHSAKFCVSSLSCFV